MQYCHNCGEYALQDIVTHTVICVYYENNAEHSQEPGEVVYWCSICGSLSDSEGLRHVPAKESKC